MLECWNVGMMNEEFMIDDFKFDWLSFIQQSTIYNVMQIQRDSLRFLRYAVDFFCITLSFFVSLNYLEIWKGKKHFISLNFRLTLYEKSEINIQG